MHGAPGQPGKARGAGACEKSPVCQGVFFYRAVRRTPCDEMHVDAMERPGELAARELARTHARYRAELARVDLAASNRDNAVAYERACALRVGGVVWGDMSPTQFELVVPNAWHDRRDNGIDVVTLDRKLVVQCKNHGAGTPVQWRHYATFTAMWEVVGMVNTKYLWVNPDTPIDTRVKKMVEMKHVTLRRESLEDMLKKLGITYDSTQPLPPQTACAQLEVRPYMPKVVELLRAQPVVVGQFPCSLGKSYIYAYAFEQLAPQGRLLVVVPSRDLLAQSRALLQSRGFAPHTPSGPDDCAEQSVVVATYQWLMDNTLAGRFDLVVQDECHHTTELAPRFREGLGRVEADRRLLLSATPRDGQRPDIRITPAEAVTAGWVCDCSLHCLYVDHGDPTLKCVCARLAHSADEWGPTIVYWNTTESARKAARQLTDELDTPCTCLTGDDTDQMRLDAAEALRRGKIKVISVCRVFIEGRSIDEVQTVVFGDTRQSATELIQIAGRPTRLHPHKSHGRVVMFTSVNDLKTNRELGRFLRAMAEGDERVRASISRGDGARVRIGPVYVTNDDSGIKGNSVPVCRHVSHTDGHESGVVVHEQVIERLSELMSGGTMAAKWVRLERFVRGNGRVPTCKENEPMYNMWYRYVTKLTCIQHGDAACDRCKRLKELRDAERQKREEHQKREECQKREERQRHNNSLGEWGRHAMGIVGTPADADSVFAKAVKDSLEMQGERIRAQCDARYELNRKQKRVRVE